MHRSFGAGSVSDAATDYGQQYGITVIDGGCPLMFNPTADVGHKAIRVTFSGTGKVPGRCEPLPVTGQAARVPAWSVGRTAGSAAVLSVGGADRDETRQLPLNG
ncbi:MAG: hypothetical protein ACJ8CN_13135 [Gemmatimonadales bacterium]